MTTSPTSRTQGRLPPQSKQAEMAVLCSCLDSEAALTVVAAVLIPDDFYFPAHRLIFLAILELVSVRSPIDIITVSELLAKKGELENVGGTEYISKLSDMPVIRSNAAEYAGIIRQKSMLRKLITSLDDVVKLSFEGEQEANNLVDLAIQRLTSIRENPTGGGFETIHDILKRTIQEIVDISKGKKERNVVFTGFPMLDKAIGGLRPGSLIIIAARPAMGKSAFVINLATNTSINYGTPVAFFSLEMSKAEIGNRILASKSSISTHALQSAEIHEGDWDQIGKAMSVLSPIPFYIDDRSGINTIEMMAKCRQLKNEKKLGLIIIDYLQLMSPAGSRNSGNRQQEISEISRSLKIMAKELDVPVIALSQLSRGAEYREDRRPLLADLRDSGAIEQDADMVVFLYRDKYYETGEKPEIEDAEVIIAKNRQGATRTVTVKWWARRTLFFEPDQPGSPEAPPEYVSSARTELPFTPPIAEEAKHVPAPKLNPFAGFPEEPPHRVTETNAPGYPDVPPPEDFMGDPADPFGNVPPEDFMGDPSDPFAGIPPEEYLQVPTEDGVE